MDLRLLDSVNLALTTISSGGFIPSDNLSNILIKNSNEIVRIIVKQFAEKRDAYSKAKFLYEKKSSIVTELVKIKSNVNEGFQNFSRPNKKERRALTQLKNTENFIK